MAKRKPKRAKSTEQLQEESDQRKRLMLIASGVPAFRVEGDKVHDFETNVKAIKIKHQSIVDKWMHEGGPGFDEPQARAIHHCRELWHSAGDCGKLVANLDWIGGGGGGREGGLHQVEALFELHAYKRKFPYWNIFEDVVRWDTPASIAGEHLARGSGRRIEKVRQVVGQIASVIAYMRGY